MIYTDADISEFKSAKKEYVPYVNAKPFQIFSGILERIYINDREYVEFDKDEPSSLLRLERWTKAKRKVKE